VSYRTTPASNLVRFAARRDAPVVCARCGRSVPRQARQQLYCSDTCRERSRERSRKIGAGAIKRGPGYPTTGAPANPLKNVNGFKSLPAPKIGSSIAFQAPRHVIEAEIFGGRRWRPAVSGGGAICEVSTWRKRTLVGRDAP
jgi:hypothetical protein